MSMNRKARERSEAGMVSIIVTMVMMIVVSLIVLGFAQISRREERAALDNQLSSQAYLAAETGLNDAYNAIETGLASGQYPQVEEKNYCGTPADPHSEFAVKPTSPYNPDINSASGVAYTCLLVTTHLPNIVASVGADGSSVTVPIHPIAPDQVKTLKLEWTAPTKLSAGDANTKCAASVPANGSLPVGSSWNCPYSLLRVDLVPTDSSKLDRTDLMNNQMAIFFYPTHAGSASINYASAKGKLTAMACDDNSCKVSIKNFPNTFTNYAMRISSVYKSGGTINITALKTGAAPINLEDAQVAIDSTGKAQDVLRRIQARLPLIKTSDTNLYALESGSSICKRFGVGATITITDVQGQDQNNPYCDVLTTSPPTCLTGCGPGFTNDAALVVTYCDVHTCNAQNNSPNPNAKPLWSAFVANQSPLDPSRIIGCTWNMGDGKSTDANGLKNQHCTPGDHFSYAYPSNPSWKKCGDVPSKTSYKIVLTEILQGNKAVPSPPQSVVVPPNCH